MHACHGQLPRWMPVYKDNFVAQVCESVWDATRRAGPQDNAGAPPFVPPVAKRNISGGEAIAATLVVPGKQSNSLSTSWDCEPSIRSRRRTQGRQRP